MDREEISFLVWIYVSQMLKAENIKKSEDFTALADIITKNHRQVFNTALNEDKKELEPEIELVTEQKQLELLVEKINQEAKLPEKAHQSDAGYDLFALENTSIPPYGQAKISTGIKLAIPENFVGLIWDKSSLAAQGLKTMGGVIDSGYRGEIIIIAKNLTEEFFNITKGQKIAQIIIQEIGTMPLVESKILDGTDRENNGFGSSGKF